MMMESPKFILKTKKLWFEFYFGQEESFYICDSITFNI